ncbi:MAG: glycosyltransferase family 4 protein [Rubrivivax sp.]|nr:glycosyltransferase family 4 protein [Rubrivivax sp.]
MFLAWLFGVLLVSVACAALLHFSHGWHSHWTSDTSKGIQKHHHGNPSRVGLIPIGVGSLAAVWLMANSGDSEAAKAADLLATVLICAAPAALIGLAEDITKRIRARWRLLGPMLGVCLGAILLGALLPRAGVPGLDSLLGYWPVALLATMLMIVGFTHAMNIVDGLNGLASGLAVLMLLATAAAAFVLGDTPIMMVCCALAAAVLGFMFLNFPRGLIFLGDGGAYFLGFVLALIWVVMVARHPGEISPWFIMAVAFHPTMETIFSIVRRKLRRHPRPATAPDRLHLHTLLMRRRTRPALAQAPRWVPNAGAACIVLACALVPMMMALMAPGRDAWGAAICLLGVLLYLGLFRHMVRFGWIFGSARATPVRVPAARQAPAAALATPANQSSSA